MSTQPTPMELVLPPTNLRCVTLQHTKGIENAVVHMQLMLDQGKFPGKHRTAFALHHTEVSKRPMNFFVMHKDYEYLFGTRVIINPRILERRGERFTSIEGCLSFPFKDLIRIQRHPRVMAEYEVANPDGTLVQVTKMLEGLTAEIFQHEVEHSEGKNIYQKTH